MIVRTAAAYALPAWHEDGNGCAAGGGLGSLAVGPGQSQSFELELIDAATGQPAVLPEFFISFFDIDGDGDAVEHVSVRIGGRLPRGRLRDHPGRQHGRRVLVHGRRLHVRGGDAPDPTDPTMLSEDQVKRTVTFMFNGNRGRHPHRRPAAPISPSASVASRADVLAGAAVAPLLLAPPPGAPSMVDCSNNIQLNFEAVCAEGYAFTEPAGAGPDGKWLGARRSPLPPDRHRRRPPRRPRGDVDGLGRRRDRRRWRERLLGRRPSRRWRRAEGLVEVGAHHGEGGRRHASRSRCTTPTPTSVSPSPGPARRRRPVGRPRVLLDPRRRRRRRRRGDCGDGCVRLRALDAVQPDPFREERGRQRVGRVHVVRDLGHRGGGRAVQGARDVPAHLVNDGITEYTPCPAEGRSRLRTTRTTAQPQR